MFLTGSHELRGEHPQPNRDKIKTHQSILLVLVGFPNVPKKNDSSDWSRFIFPDRSALSLFSGMLCQEKAM